MMTDPLLQIVHEQTWAELFGENSGDTDLANTTADLGDGNIHADMLETTLDDKL
jgi:hypothetical protein